MRYFGSIQYNGTRYSGWQRQLNANSVQEEIENVLSQVLREKISIIGCGRTDAGVHASQYYFHLDTREQLTLDFAKKVNCMVSDDISILEFIVVDNDAHARFDAISRSYIYHLVRRKDPFRKEITTHFPFFDKLNIDLLKQSAELLFEFEEFFPFCKTNSDVNNYRCAITKCEWVLNQAGNELCFHISANRFLRGMVRLIVGMCLNVSLGKISLEEVYKAMESQSRLTRPLSVGPGGLFLSGVEYPFFKTDASI